jgi:SAM-dependent methyltransferase
MSGERNSSIPAAYFEDKFKADIDPWRFRTSPYEQDKYRATLAALTKHCYRRALEIGCAIGVLSSYLAPRCERLLALDGSETAIAEASQQNLHNVQFETAFLPNDFPSGTFDLIMISEVLYYFSKSDLGRVAERCLRSLDPGGEMILCHWLGETDYPLTGYQASDLFANAAASRRPTRVILHDEIYRLERLSF